MKTNKLVEELIRQNPNLTKDTKYLIMEVWDREGLRLYPVQRDLFLSKNLSAAEAITRAARKAKIKIRKEQEAVRRSHFDRKDS